MKRGTTPTLKIKIDKINIEDIKKVEFVFKSRKQEASETILLKSYPLNVSYKDDIFLLDFTDAETRLFTSGSTVFMDTRIVFNDGTVPETDIVEIPIKPTLFEEVTQ